MYHYFAEALRKEQHQKQSARNNITHSKRPQNVNNIQSIKENQVKSSKLSDGLKLQPPPQPKTFQTKPLKEPNLNIKEISTKMRDIEKAPQPLKVEVQPVPINEFPTEPVKLIECPEGCGRKFNEKVLQKHVKVCRKVFQDTREVFDSKAQRDLDEQASIQLNKQQQKKKKGKKTDWKQQSEAFRMMIQKSKNPDMKLNEDQEQMIRQMTTADLILCDSCGRKFSEKAAEKHIPFCKQQKMKRK